MTDKEKEKSFGFYINDSPDQISKPIKTNNEEVSIPKIPKKNTLQSGLRKLFGYRFNKNTDVFSKRNNLVTFLKVDPEHDLAIAQGKLGATFKTKMSSKIEELFDIWLNDSSIKNTFYQNRFLRISELEFAVNNSPYLGQTANMYADEATQLDQQDSLIAIYCDNLLQKKRMEELLLQWGVTQNRSRNTMWNLAVYGDSFWANQITENGVVKIHPLDIRQVIDRLEFNPVRVMSDQNLKNGYNVSASLSRATFIRALVDAAQREDSETHDEFTDIFNTKLFGYIIAEDYVVPAWSITHFRYQWEQSEFAPFGKPLLIHAIAPFKQLNIAMGLQSLARIANMPLIYYGVDVPKGMDIAQKWDRIHTVKDMIENMGEQGNPTDSYSVNTKIWGPKDELNIQAISPNIDLNAIADLEFLQNREAIGGGVPRNYMEPDWANMSGIALIERSKPFARKVYSLQSAFLEQLSWLFRLHAAVTGDFNYMEPFILTMNFPNSENSDERVQAKQRSLELAKGVIDTISSLIAAVDDPLPPEIIKDIVSKYSFLNSKDLEKWMSSQVIIKNQAKNANDENMPDETPDDFGGMTGGDGGGGDFGAMPTGGMEAGGEEPTGAETGGGEGENEEGAGEELNSEDLNIEEPQEKPAKEESYNIRSLPYEKLVEKVLPEKRRRILFERYSSMKETVYKEVLKTIIRFDETVSNNKHIKGCVLRQEDTFLLEAAKLHYRQPDKIRVSLQESMEYIDKHIILNNTNFNEGSKNIQDILKEMKG